jgi:hypothetical protein
MFTEFTLYQHAIYAGSTVYNVGYGEHQPRSTVLKVVLSLRRMLSTPQHLVHLHVVAPAPHSISTSVASVRADHARYEHGVLCPCVHQHRYQFSKV